MEFEKKSGLLWVTKTVCKSNEVVNGDGETEMID